jgi:ABC-type uncharacterized transport system involved in gliding motility auxiliary subunit
VKRVWIIARRDVKALFDQPTGYVLLVVFLAVNAFLFFRNAYIANTATLRPMIDFLPWLFLFFVPAVAMRSLAEDTRSGLLEIVLAQPVSEAELLLGKYLGVVIVLLAALAASLVIPLGLTLGSHLPWGPVVAQYVGASLLAAAFAGVGVWASSLGKSQITAFILAVAVMFVLILVGLDPLLVGLPPVLGAIAARLGVLSHFESVGRGVLDLRDVLYFLSVGAVFLALAYAVLMRRRLAPASATRRQLQLGTILLCAVVIAIDLAGGEIGGRLDLTPGGAYTLSRATKAIVRSVPDLVTIRLYASKDLPSQFALDKRDVDDLLRDLRSAGRGKIRVIEQDPASDTAAADEAQNFGIVPVQFNVVGQSELQVKQGYFGLAVQYAGKHEAIPFIRQTDDLEYRLASTIRDLTRTTKPTVALLADSAAGSYAAFRQQLARSYTVETPDLADSTTSLTDVTALIVASAHPTVSPAEQVKVAAYLSGGGKAMILASGMAVAPRGPFAQRQVIEWNPVLEPFGVQIRQDMVYDLRANQLVSMPTSYGTVLRPYPYFLRGRSTRASPINADLSEVDLPWASSVDSTGSKTSVATPLIVTSDAAGASSGEVMIDPSQSFATTDLGRRVLGVQVAPRAGGKGARLVVVGDAMLANDPMAQRSPGNLVFALNAVDWLAQDEGLISIRAKNRLPPPLVFSSNGLRASVKYGNVVVLPILVAAYGVVRLLKRRRLAATPYARGERGERAA